MLSGKIILKNVNVLPDNSKVIKKLRSIKVISCFHMKSNFYYWSKSVIFKVTRPFYLKIFQVKFASHKHD